MMREVDLLMYLPSVMKRYSEMQKIMDTENPEFNLLWDADELIRQNLYIVTAQEEGLRRYEKILGVNPSPDDDFETRRIRIITRWNDFRPYTMRYLMGLLTVLTNGKFRINTNFSEYEIEIVVTLLSNGAVDELGYVFKHIIPCNLTIISKNEIPVAAVGNVWMASTIVHAGTYMITNDFAGEYRAKGSLSGGMALVQTNVLSASNDFEAKYEMAGQLNNAAAIVQSTVKLMTNDFDVKYAANGRLNSGSTAITVTQNILER